jgi:hypothetical protein
MPYPERGVRGGDMTDGLTDACDFGYGMVYADDDRSVVSWFDGGTAVG